MKEIQSGIWRLTVPDTWVSEDDGEMVSLYDPEGYGTLVVSSVIEDEPISDEYLEELVSEHLDAGADLHEEAFGPFTGVGCCFELDEHYWCEWYLRLENLFLYITYNCELEQEGEEDDVVEGILDSLSLNQPAKDKLH